MDKLFARHEAKHVFKNTPDTGHVQIFFCGREVTVLKLHGENALEINTDGVAKSEALKKQLWKYYPPGEGKMP